MSFSNKHYTQYTTVSYSGARLLEKHSLDEVGIWQIFGEDPNCDMHGPHHQPDLGIVEGKLEDVIRHAVALPKFWQWGAGGDIKYIGKTIPKVDLASIEHREELKEQARILEEQLKAIKAEIGNT